MKRSTLVAGGLSLTLHAAVLVSLGVQRAQVARPTAPAAAVPMEMIRVSRIVSSRLAEPTTQAQSPHVHPERSRGIEARAARVDPAPPVNPARSLTHADQTPSDEEPSVSPEPATPPSGGEDPSVHPERSRGTDAPASTAPSLDSARDERQALDTTALSRRLNEGAKRCYPAAASRFRQTGEAQVFFCLDGAGALRERNVASSSGSELLDHAALGCVVPGAAPFGPETFGRCFTVPVRFGQ